MGRQGMQLSQWHQPPELDPILGVWTEAGRRLFFDSSFTAVPVEFLSRATQGDAAKGQGSSIDGEQVQLTASLGKHSCLYVMRHAMRRS